MHYLKNHSSAAKKIYQGYLAYKDRFFNLKIGQFSNYYSKGYNAIKDENKLLGSTVFPFLTYGNIKNSTLKGGAFTFRKTMSGLNTENRFYAGENNQE